MENLQRMTQQTDLAKLLGVHLSNTPIKTFTGVLSLSILLDIVWLMLHGGNPLGERGFAFATGMNILSLIVKPVSVLAAVNTIQGRGDTITVGGWSEAPGAFPGAYQTVRDSDGFA
ncbi:hypothetical protein BDF14DRAFT_1310680 [Spinellus fusiger]|nr:hypothetical protein BDF14DRAFT_1310680 [Spinellus fusiger]